MTSNIDSQGSLTYKIFFQKTKKKKKKKKFPRKVKIKQISIFTTTRQTFTCSKSTIETSEEGVKYVQS